MLPPGGNAVHILTRCRSMKTILIEYDVFNRCDAIMDFARFHFFVTAQSVALILMVRE